MKHKNQILLSFLFILFGLLVIFFPNKKIIKPETENQIQPRSSMDNVQMFGRVAVLDEGRIKPLDTYARNVLLQFSGKRTFEKKPAIDWLAKVLFTPWNTYEDKIFLINSPEIPMALGIKTDTHRRYSFSQIEDGLAKLRQLAVAAEAIEQKERNIVENEILRVYHNLNLYLQLRSTFSFTIPHPDFTVQETAAKTSLDFSESKKDFSFLDIALKADLLNEETQDLEKKKSDIWSVSEKEFMRLLRNLYQWSLNSSQGGLALIPPVYPADETWNTPWEVTRQSFSNQEIRHELGLIQNMANAYLHEQQLEFNIAAKAFNIAIQTRLSKAQKKATIKIPFELFYNQSQLFFYAWVFYLLAFFLFLFSLIWPRPLMHTIGFCVLVIAFIPHLLALILRAIIMTRPPVTNLYETFIFVGFVTVLLGIVTELFHRKWLGIVVGSICGLIFLSIADKFSAEGDTLRMLVAVLNSNFWLGTHVVSITIGYSGCCVAGIMGHVYILQALARPKDTELLRSTHRYILGILGFGLTMSFLGTMLGGIWADQSWGRFWGWDPKENGALLIVLWTALVFHAKIARMIRPLGVAVGASLGLIVVMWAWFGVNLLSIGLHSYGFTSGLALNLLIYAVLEVLFLSVSVIILRQKNIFL